MAHYYNGKYQFLATILLKIMTSWNVSVRHGPKSGISPQNADNVKMKHNLGKKLPETDQWTCLALRNNQILFSYTKKNSVVLVQNTVEWPYNQTYPKQSPIIRQKVVC